MSTEFIFDSSSGPATDQIRALAALASAEPGLTLLVDASSVKALQRELGPDAAADWLIALPNEFGQPIGVQLLTYNRTIFLPPLGWTEEQNRHWVAARHEELEAELGPFTEVRRHVTG